MMSDFVEKKEQRGREAERDCLGVMVQDRKSVCVAN